MQSSCEHTDSPATSFCVDGSGLEWMRSQQCGLFSSALQCMLPSMYLPSTVFLCPQVLCDMYHLVRYGHKAFLSLPAVAASGQPRTAGSRRIMIKSQLVIACICRT
jgi:hypothetical protein